MIEINKMSIAELERAYKHVQAERKSYAAQESELKDEIVRRYSEQLSEQLRNKDEPFGAVRIDNIKFNVPKKVEWDQSLLADLYKEIGDTANEYMDVLYKVREAAFKNWPSAIQESFIPARTVKPGAVTIEIGE